MRRKDKSIPRVLSIAGTDPTGGAGIQADLKSIGANGGYGMAVVTALVAQNTGGVRSSHTPPVSFLREQLDAVSDDVVIDAVKIGMLGQRAVIETVAEWLQPNRPPVVVLDPVMVATSGDRLLATDAEEALCELVNHVDLVTPNLAELGVLLQEPPAADWDEALEQARRLSTRHGTAVLVKGGHLASGGCPDAVVDMSLPADQQVHELNGQRIATRNTHGTGCSLSSALAAVRPQTESWIEALSLVKDWLGTALEQSQVLDVGNGRGPVHHFHRYKTEAPDTFSRRLWEDTAGVRGRIFALEFIGQLERGTLGRQQFDYYLSQDAVYLQGYARVLHTISSLAPTEADSVFWADAAANCINVEAELHREWLGTDATAASAGPVTEGYLQFLESAADTDDYAVAVAAVVPCFWLYAHVGETLHGRYLQQPEAAAHPYRAWLDTYADPAFRAATDRAVRIMDFAAAAAGPGNHGQVREAFTTAAAWELEFFDAPMPLHLRQGANLAYS
ncbi:bifunctional hydroxymethylpyrimidine kinase/phosphomethylpyrimidine kinase [Arthrobacter castelli]|uniref:bifunctional hydroxymethylpyrimidine kinase/phosphomethylpyrimidine kinase n=1 Tax=Arthrobacter castelli TaxID=271431 RepID=UPI0004179B13|nr:bifunctional hydroxymethylpyrimidine kinase/phosphomethylpyrimidine kinase [Arthrobacter castelli]